MISFALIGEEEKKSRLLTNNFWEIFFISYEMKNTDSLIVIAKDMKNK